VLFGCCYIEEFEDTNGIIRIRISKKNREHNGQKEKVQRTKNDLQTIQIKLRRVWRYQRGNQNPYIEEEPTTQWPKEKVQKEKQRSTKHTYKAKDRVAGTPLKTGGELRYSRRVSSSYSTSGTRHVNLTTNPVISHQLGKNREVLSTIFRSLAVSWYTLKSDCCLRTKHMIIIWQSIIPLTIVISYWSIWMPGETYTANVITNWYGLFSELTTNLYYPITIFVLYVCPQFNNNPSIDFEYVIYNDSKLCHTRFVRTKLGRLVVWFSAFAAA
jgi:hypothetical protein